MLATSPVTLLELEAAATRTGIIASGLSELLFQFGLLPRQQKHHIRRGTLGAQLRRHHLHRAVDVVEESTEARAQIIQSRFAVGRVDEAVFRTAAVADKAHLARAAIAR